MLTRLQFIILHGSNLSDLINFLLAHGRVLYLFLNPFVSLEFILSLLCGEILYSCCLRRVPIACTGYPLATFSYECFYQVQLLLSASPKQRATFAKRSVGGSNIDCSTRTVIWRYYYF